MLTKGPFLLLSLLFTLNEAENENKTLHIYCGTPELNFSELSNCLDSGIERIASALSDDYFIIYFLAHEALQNSANAEQPAQLKAKFDQIISQVEPKKNKIVQTAAAEALKNENEIIQRIYKSYGAEIVNFYLPHIIKNSYQEENHDNLANLFEYMSKLPEESSWCVASSALFEEMQRAGKLRSDEGYQLFLYNRFVLEDFPDSQSQENSDARNKCVQVQNSIGTPAKDEWLPNLMKYNQPQDWFAFFQSRPLSFKWIFSGLMKQDRGSQGFLNAELREQLLDKYRSKYCLGIDQFKIDLNSLNDADIFEHYFHMILSEKSIVLGASASQYLYFVCYSSIALAPKWIKILFYGETQNCTQIQNESSTYDKVYENFIATHLNIFYDNRLDKFNLFGLRLPAIQNLKDAQLLQNILQCSTHLNSSQTRTLNIINEGFNTFIAGINTLLSDWSGVNRTIITGFLAEHSNPTILKGRSVAVAINAFYFKMKDAFLPELVDRIFAYPSPKEAEFNLNSVASMPFISEKNCDVLKRVYIHAVEQNKTNSYETLNLWLIANKGNPQQPCLQVSENIENFSKIYENVTLAYVRNFNEMHWQKNYRLHEMLPLSMSNLLPKLVKRKFDGTSQITQNLTLYMSKLWPVAHLCLGFESLAKEIAATANQVDDFSTLAIFSTIEKILLIAKISHVASLPDITGYSHCTSAQSYGPSWVRQLLSLKIDCETDSHPSEKKVQKSNISSEFQKIPIEAMIQGNLMELINQHEMANAPDHILFSLLPLTQVLEKNAKCSLENYNNTSLDKVRKINLMINALSLFKQGVYEINPVDLLDFVEARTRRFANRLVDINLADLKSQFTHTDAKSTVHKLVELPSVLNHCDLIKTIFTKLTEKDLDDSDEAFQLYLLALGGARQHPYQTFNSESTTPCSKVKQLFKTHSTPHIDSYVNYFENYDYEKLHAKHSSNQYSMSWILPDFIERVYNGKVSNGETLLKYIKIMPWLNDDCVGLDALVGQINKHHQWDTSLCKEVAFYLHRTMKKRHYPLTPRPYRNYCERASRLSAFWAQYLLSRNTTACTVKNLQVIDALAQDDLRGPWLIDVNEADARISIAVDRSGELSYLAIDEQGSVSLQPQKFFWTADEEGFGAVQLSTTFQKETRVLSTQEKPCTNGKCVQALRKEGIKNLGTLWLFECE